MGIEVSVEEVVEGKYGVWEDGLLEKLGINGKIDRMEKMLSMGEEKIGWIVGEIMGGGIRSGMGEGGLYGKMIGWEEWINGLEVSMGMVNMWDGGGGKVNEGERIGLGDVRLGEKWVCVLKMGKGFKVSEEVKN